MFWSGSSIIIKNTSSCEDPWLHFTYSYQSLRRTPLAPHEGTSKKDVRFAENGSGAPRARERIHPRNFGCDVSVLRPSIHSLLVREGNQVSARGGGGGGVCYIFLAGNRAMHWCNPRLFGGKSRKKWCGYCRRVQKLVYFRNYYPCF